MRSIGARAKERVTGKARPAYEINFKQKKGFYVSVIHKLKIPEFVLKGKKQEVNYCLTKWNLMPMRG